MKQNIGKTDKIIRLVIAAGLVGLYFTNLVPQVVGIIAAGLVGLYFTNLVPQVVGIIAIVLAVILAATALIGFCGLYTLLGISTCPVKKEK